MKAIPITQKEANAYVEKYHRHHSPVRGDKFRIGCINDSGDLIGIVQVGRPVSRIMDDGKTLEVTRLCTNGERNVCSFLYIRAARIAQELGYSRIITYILDSENGASLRACGWEKETETKGRSWDCPSRPRELIETQLSFFGDNKPKYSTENKQRYIKLLKEGKQKND